VSGRLIFSKEDLLSPNLELHSIAKLASIFKTRKFKLELLPYKEGEIRLFKANCASCNYSTIVKWPINTTNLNTHYRNKHFNINYNNNSNSDSDSNNEENSTIESSSLNSNNINTLGSYFKSSNTIRKRPSFVFFSKEEYRNTLLFFIVN
jgi:hypothetical protein